MAERTIPPGEFVIFIDIIVVKTGHELGIREHSVRNSLVFLMWFPNDHHRRSGWIG
jgi:hypothetical protein